MDRTELKKRYQSIKNKIEKSIKEAKELQKELLSIRSRIQDLSKKETEKI
jgi:predicted nuclease with TOPRIM domain